MAKTILHVEDDPAILEAVKLICEKEGYEVIGYQGMEDALEGLKSCKPDMAILDIMMESMDAGLVIYEKIQEACPEVPCIFLTSLGDEVQHFFMERAKWGFVLQKPVEPDSLLTAIKDRIGD